MIRPSRTNRWLVDAQIQCRDRGAFIRLRWTNWPYGKPAIDPTTGAYSSSGSQYPVMVNCATRAFSHFCKPTESMSRIYAEIKVGDCILDFVIPLYLVGSSGDTTLVAGSVVDYPTFNKANLAALAANPNATIATASNQNVQLSSLENVAVSMYQSPSDWTNDQNGEKWVQAKIGKDLASSWESVYSGRLLGQAILVRRAT